MIFLLSFFWAVRTARALVFAVYLWQLKEYHIKRFLAHFSTAKGKRLFAHPFIAAKLLFLVLWLYYPTEAGLFLLALYVGETALTFRALRKNSLLLPVLTKKTAVLMLSAGFVQAVFLLAVLYLFPEYLVPSLLFFDLFSLAIGTAVVLLWQPYTVFVRKGVLEKARKKRESMKGLKVVGITGSYGKTSTKEILAHILQKKFVTLKTPEHKNSEMGIAHTIVYDLTDEHEVFVAEMGAYSKGGIKILADMAKPDIGIVTGVNEQHLGVFGSAMNLFSAEGGGELLSSLPPQGTLILNDDSRQLHELGPWLQLWNPNFAEYLWCSAVSPKDFYAKNVKVKKEELSFTIVGKEGEEAAVVLPLIGAHHAENVLLASAAAEVLGMSVAEIAEALKDFLPELGSVRKKQGKKGLVILDSSYSANPTGVLAQLEHLSLWKGKKILVMPSLIELGPASRELHFTIGKKIGEVADFALITTSDEYPALLAGAVKAGMKEGNMLFAENPKEIAQRILSLAGKEDVALFQGRVPRGILPLIEA